MEMEQWDDGTDAFQENSNINAVDDNGDSSYHQNQYDDEYNNNNNQDNDYSNQYNNNYNDNYNDNYTNNNNDNNNNNNNNYNNDNYSNYNNRGYNVSRNNNYNNYNNYNNNSNNNNNYRKNTYRRHPYNNNQFNNNQYNNNQYNNNRGYNRNRGRYRGNKYGRYRGNKQYNYQQKRNQYEKRRRQYQPKNTQNNQYQNQNQYQDQYQSQKYNQYETNDKNDNIQSNQDRNTEIYNNASNTSNPSRPSRASRASRPNTNRFGKKQKFKRTIEENIDFEEDKNDENQNDEQYEHDAPQHAMNESNDKTIYTDESKAISNMNYAPNHQHGFNNRNRYNQQNSVELENLSVRGKKLAIQLINGEYDCPVCFKKIGKNGRIWKCTHCFAMFHLTCINEWARTKEASDAKSEQRSTKRDHEISKLKCPACNFVDRNFKFDQYKCYCGKIIFDHTHRREYNYQSVIPHSCGNICGKKRGSQCPHPCPAECHPGPCQPCKLPSNRKGSCPCGKMTYSLLCGQIESTSRLCNQICDKLLKCGNHRCQLQCHDGECKQCDIRIEQECFCGKHKKLQSCGTGIKVIIDIDNDNKNKQLTVWKYSCNKICNKTLSCKHHKCTLKCHNGSCSVCPRRIEIPTRCACGKTTFNDIKRTSCLDPLPVCDKKCARMLGCGQHFCRSQCHDSKCALCMVQVKKRCRCGASEKRFKCHDYQKKLKQFISSNSNALLIEGKDSWIRCGKKCKRVKSCGQHQCAEICCRGRNIRTYFEQHQCRELCNKPLSCGRHRCSSYCHRKNCNPCGVTYRNGVQCACGNVYVPGPFQCGTKTIPTCNSTCDKVLGCGHRCSAKCHHGDCPNCIRICSKPCISHGLLVHNMPCHVENRSCGNPCGKLLLCGIHRCNRTCHSGICIILNNNGCGQICGLPLKCGHKCMKKCHALSGQTQCNSEACKAQITVKCKCGNTSDREYCRGRTEYELKAVPCTEHCQIAQRNKRFREALNIQKPSEKNTENEINSEKKESDTIRIPFAASVLKRILKWMHEDKGHTMIIKQDKKIIAPKFVYYIEGLLNAYISDSSQDCHQFKSKYNDITVLISSTSSPIINLKPMSSEQRFIVYSITSHYHIRAEKKENSGKHGLSYLELSKTKHSRIADYLLSTAIIEYQIRGDQIETLESMPPSNIIVIDNGLDISSSTIQDRLLAWTGDYRMYKKNQQIFIVFTDQNARNSAMTEMKKFGARKANQSDSLNANIAQKKNQQRKKNKLKQQQSHHQQQQQQHSASTSTSNAGWSTIGNAHAVTANNMTKLKPETFNIKMNNRFG